MAVAGLASSLPVARELLLFERPERTEAWRLLGTQLLHPNLATAVADLVLLTLGSLWLERRSRGAWLAVLTASALAVSASVAWAPSELRSYEGASGLAAGMLSAALLTHALGLAGGARAAFFALALLPTIKALLELAGWSWSSAHLPSDVQVFVPAHLAGALAGLTVAGAWSCATRRATQQA